MSIPHLKASVTSDDVIAAIEDAGGVLRLIGYQRGAYAPGYVDDLRDPMDFVRPDLAKRGMAR